jgi:hypothetical protein
LAFSSSLHSALGWQDRSYRNQLCFHINDSSLLPHRAGFGAAAFVACSHYLSIKRSYRKVIASLTKLNRKRKYWYILYIPPGGCPGTGSLVAAGGGKVFLPLRTFGEIKHTEAHKTIVLRALAYWGACA